MENVCSIEQKQSHAFRPRQPNVSKNLLVELKTRQAANNALKKDPCQNEADLSLYEKRTISPRAKNCSARNKGISRFDILSKRSSLNLLNKKSFRQEPSGQVQYAAPVLSVNTHITTEIATEDIATRELCCSPDNNHSDGTEDYTIFKWCVIC